MGDLTREAQAELAKAERMRIVTEIRDGRNRGVLLVRADGSVAYIDGPRVAALVADLQAACESFRSLAKQATNGWACYAKRRIEHDAIATLHADIDALAATQPAHVHPAKCDHDVVCTTCGQRWTK